MKIYRNHHLMNLINFHKFKTKIVGIYSVKGVLTNDKDQVVGALTNTDLNNSVKSRGI